MYVTQETEGDLHSVGSPVTLRDWRSDENI